MHIYCVYTYIIMYIHAVCKMLSIFLFLQQNPSQKVVQKMAAEVWNKLAVEDKVGWQKHSIQSVMEWAKNTVAGSP